jgi:hypothetical protein
VLVGQHTLMKNSTDEDFPAYLAIKEDMSAVFDPAVFAPNHLTSSTEPWIQRDTLTAIQKVGDVADRLYRTPCVHRIVGDAFEVHFSQFGKKIPSQISDPIGMFGALENTLLDTAKDSVWRDAAGFPGNDRFPDSG